MIQAAFLAMIAVVLGFGPQPLVTPPGARVRQGAIMSAGLGVAAAVVFFGAQAMELTAKPWLFATVAMLLLGVLVIDLRSFLIPDLYVLGLLFLAFVGPLAPPPLFALAGGLVGGGLLWGVRLWFRWRRGQEGLGLGDVKLMVAVGALVGPVLVAQVILAGAVLGIALALAPGGTRLGERRAAPFGAAVAVPAFIALVSRFLP